MKRLYKRFVHAHDHGGEDADMFVGLPGMRGFMRGGRRRGHMHGGGRSGQRGDLKFAILEVLADRERHGYDVMREIEERRGGIRPSPGSIYPALAMLQDGDFLTSREMDGKRLYAITETGRALLAEHVASGNAATGEGDDAMRELLVGGFKSMHGLMSAAKEVTRSGNDVAIKRVVEVLDRARREVYAILADEL